VREKYLIGIPGEEDADVGLQYDRSNEELMVRSNINYSDVLDNLVDSLGLEDKCPLVKDKSGVHMRKYARYTFQCCYVTFRSVRAELEKQSYSVDKTRKLWRK
jgi:hypothetical protein